MAQYLHVPVSWVYKHTRPGAEDVIPHQKMGKYLRFDPDSKEFQEWIESHRFNGYDRRRSKKNGSESEAQRMTRISYQQGSIEKRKRKKGTVYMLRYRLRDGDKWVSRSEELVDCKTDRQAERIRQYRMVEINEQNNNPRPKPITMNEFLDGLWRSYVEQRNYKPSTLYGYDSMLRLYIVPHFGEMLLPDITPEKITRFLDSLRQQRREGKYLRNIYVLLRLLFEVALEYDKITISPVRPKLHLPHWERKEKPALKPEQIQTVIQHIAPEYRLVFAVAAITGLRVGELIALRWENLLLDDRLIAVNSNLWRNQLVAPKTKSSYRVIRIPARLAQLLTDHRAASMWQSESDFVFCREDGQPLNPDTLRKHVLYPALAAAGIERKPREHGMHLFRHSAGTIIHSETRDLETARKLFGHSSQGTTSGYTHADVEITGEATDILAEKILANCVLSVPQSLVSVN